MIEEFETEKTDYFSIAGRTALVGGGAYGVFKTFKDLKSNTPINPGEKSFASKVGRLRNVRPATEPAAKAEKQVGKTIADVLGLNPVVQAEKQLKSKVLTDFSLLSNMGYRNPGELPGKLSQFTSMLKDKGYTGVNVFYKSNTAGEVGGLLIRGKFNGASYTFPVNPVSKNGTAFFGNNLQNQLAARSVIDNASLGTSNLRIIDPDIALLEKYTQEIDSVSRGVTNPRDLFRKIQDALIFQGDSEQVSQFQNIVGELRKGEAVIDPFGELSSKAKKDFMRNIASQPQYMAGSASSFAKGVITTPESILHSVLPSGGVSPAAYQYIRESSFDPSLRPKTDFFGGLDLGLGEFKYAYVNKDELQSTIDALSKHRDYSDAFRGIGEIADEELIMDISKNYRAKNPLYTTRVDTSMLATPAAEGLFSKIVNKLGLKDYKELGDILQNPEGLASLGPEKMKLLDFDVNEDYKALRESERKMFEELRGVRSNKSLPAADRKRWSEEILTQLKETRSVRLEYEAIGVSEDMAYATKLPAKNLTNKILNMRAGGDQISIAMQTEYSLGPSSKVFGSLKGTIKGQSSNPLLLAQNEFRAMHGRIATPSELVESGLLDMFEGVDLIGVESPVKMAGRTMEARRMPAAVMNYISTAKSEGRLQDVEALGDYADTSFENQKRIIAQIQKNHPDMQLADILAGSKREGQKSSTRISQAILSADFHSTQSGMGRTGTFTERGMMYLEAEGLDKVSENIMSRFLRDQDPIARLDTFLDAEGASSQTMAKALHADKKLNSVFHQNLEIRRDAIKKITGGSETLSVDLGRSISFEMNGRTQTINKASVFSQEHMAPYVGVQIGTTDNLTTYDRSAKELIEAAANPSVDPQVLQAKAIRYAEQQELVKESLANALLKGKVKGSMYGQATSSLPGMNEAAIKLGEEMGLGSNIPAPLIAMRKADIRKMYGKEALEQAQQGQLFGLLTKEPIEGSHSVIPTQIRVAEDFTGGSMPLTLDDVNGRIFLANSDMMRQGGMIDFDKDPVTVIAITDKEAKSQLMDFMGLTGKQSDVGREYYQSMLRMRDLSPKSGKTPVDALSSIDTELAQIITSQKQLEKANIGLFSNEFRNVHVGLREQLTQSGNAAQFFKGEDFSHVFVENIIKAKHQSKEAILKNEALETLDILRGKNKYASASRQDRALRLQEIFDQLSFGEASEGGAARNLASSILEDNMTSTLYRAGAIDKAAEHAAMSMNIDAKQARRALSYAEVSSTANLENILKAHEAGEQIAGNKTDELISMMVPGKKMSGFEKQIQRAGETTKSIMNVGLGNIFKYAIAPAAVIGLASSIFSKPNVLKESSESHDRGDAGPTVGAGKTLFAIPESKVDNIQIKGRADANTNFNYLKQRANSAGAGYNGSMKDMRSAPDKHRIQELIDRGY